MDILSWFSYDWRKSSVQSTCVRNKLITNHHLKKKIDDYEYVWHGGQCRNVGFKF